MRVEEPVACASLVAAEAEGSGGDDGEGGGSERSEGGTSGAGSGADAGEDGGDGEGGTAAQGRGEAGARRAPAAARTGWETRTAASGCHGEGGRWQLGACALRALLHAARARMDRVGGGSPVVPGGASARLYVDEEGSDGKPGLLATLMARRALVAKRCAPG